MFKAELALELIKQPLVYWDDNWRNTKSNALKAKHG